MQKTMVDTHPKLLKILGSKNPIFVFINILPAVGFFLYTLFATGSLRLADLSYFLGGVFYWSVFEYSVHRWLYHTEFPSYSVRWFFETFHLHHHRDLFDKRVLNAGPLMQYPMLFFLLLPVHIFSGYDLRAAGAAGLGLVGYYFFYECVHYGIHYKKFERGYMKYIQKYHMYHHEKVWLKNFGNTFHIWDFILGTMDDNYKNFELTKKQLESLIVNQGGPKS